MSWCMEDSQFWPHVIMNLRLPKMQEIEQKCPKHKLLNVKFFSPITFHHIEVKVGFVKVVKLSLKREKSDKLIFQQLFALSCI